MGTAAGINTRRYHGLLVAVAKPPAERTLLLAGLEETLQSDGEPISISTHQYPGTTYPEGYLSIDRFEIGDKAIWSFHAGDMACRKSIEMASCENRVRLKYENTGQKPFLLSIRPLVCHRSYHGNFGEMPDFPGNVEFREGSTEIAHMGTSLSLHHKNAMRTPVEGWYYRFEHRREIERGLDARDDLFCPCELRFELAPGGHAILEAVGAFEGETVSACTTIVDAQSSIASSPVTTIEYLRYAANQFIVESRGRKTIIAGYPWFADWGRDTMISLPGICLCTGKFDLAKAILRDHAAEMRDGLIPNRFLESGGADYNTCDATLWFANAIYKTLDYEWDEGFAREMLPTLLDVWTHHRDGTLYGIRMDQEDGLLSQGEEGVQLTWMDVKIGDWVVTPRHGKPVEVNGLWINFLRVLEWLCLHLEEDASEIRDHAGRAERSFDEKFWIESRGHFFDTIDPEDASLRPNQVIAMALPFGPARGDRAVRALQLVERELLTPVGLRTLGRGEPAYHGRYEGPLPQLDEAYHQGTVWPWLLGPYVTALVKLTGETRLAKQALSHVQSMLSECGLGSIAEVYDGDPPHRPNGCPFQAWSVAEILRAYTEDIGGN